MKNPKTRFAAFFAFVTLTAAAAGCELAVDFDRTKIDGGVELDGSFSDAPKVDSTPGDTSTTDATNDTSADAGTDTSTGDAADTGANDADANVPDVTDANVPDTADADVPVDAGDEG